LFAAFGVARLRHGEQRHGPRQGKNELSPIHVLRTRKNGWT